MSDDVFGDLFDVDQAGQAEATAVVDSQAKRTKLTGNAIVFDIETGPEDKEILANLFQFDATKVRGYELLGKQFDPSSVRYGNTKDAAKRAEKLAIEKDKFDQALAAAEAAMAGAKDEQWAEFCGRAALSATTGRVLAIGYSSVDDINNDDVDIDTDSNGEDVLLAGFWERFDELKDRGRIVGFNSHCFDLPFLIRRSWLLGVDVPRDVIRESRFWHKCFVDLMQVWGCGVYGERIGLDRVAQFFGSPRKAEGMNGADFGRLYTGTEADRKQALEYLAADLRATAGVALRMGVI